MYIQRDSEGIIKRYINTPEIIALIGARQVGKTTLLKHIHSGLTDSSLITFEDVEIRSLFDRDIKSFIQIYIKPYKYIFIDEFQYAKNAGQSLKFIYDTVRNRKILISGSSVLELTINAVKHLAGRVFSFTLSPLTFKEFLSYRDPVLYAYYQQWERKERLDDILIGKFNALLEEFIVYGGYPRVVTSTDNEERREVLRNILNVYLLKDVRDLLGLTDDYAMLTLIKALSLQTGNVISFHELSTLTQQPLPALKRYLNLLEKTYIIQLIRPFFTNKRTELVKNPKIYFYDTGLRNAVIGDFKMLDLRPDKGALYENHVFTELISRGHTLKYWRTKAKAEVDFIIDDKIPVEVKSTLSRTVYGKSLLSYIEKYQPEEAFIYNRNLFEVAQYKNTVTNFLYHFSIKDPI